MLKKTENKKQLSTKQAPAKNSPIKKSWWHWSLITLVKLTFAGFCVLGIFTIYLDAKVQKKFEGQRWQVPVQVYGQIQTLAIGENISLKAIAKSLQLNGYRRVEKVQAAKQYAQSAHRLMIFQNDFDFPASRNGIPLLSGQLITIEVEDVEEGNGRISSLLSDNVSTNKVQLEPKLLARLVPNNKEDRVLVSLEDIPNQLLDTLLLIEDREVYHHQGISPLGILRALYNNLRAGRTVQGGSTLTQQLVKNMFLTRQRSLSRKVQEALMALILESRYSKDQLLEAYLNEVYLGQNYANGVYGFGLAAQFYFSVEVDELSNAQMALLVAQVKGPSFYDPWRHPKRAKERRDLVLRLMFEQRMLTALEYEQAASSALSMRKNRRLTTQNYPAYLQLVKNELSQVLSSSMQKSGIKVFTGFSHRSQNILEETINTQLPLLENKVKQSDLQVAMVVTDITTGEIRALSGDKVNGYAGFNRALNAKRPVGSLIKPAIYLAALERYEQYNLATVLQDKAITLSSSIHLDSKALRDKGTKWQPKNYDGKYRGQVSLIEGLVHSLNIPTINLGMSLGLDNVAEAIHLLGYQGDLHMRPSMLLGSINMSPVEINQVYLPIAGKGMYQEAHAIDKVISAKGDVLWEFNSLKEQRLSTNGAYLIDYALSQVTQEGTGKSLTWRLKNSTVAGKTGTSNDLRDSWFVGYDNKHLITTWIGKDNNKPTGLTGSTGALPLFAHFIKSQGIESKKLTMPEGIAMTLFEKETGSAVTPLCDGTIRYPAVVSSIHQSNTCLQEKQILRSWFDRIFGD